MILLLNLQSDQETTLKLTDEVNLAAKSKDAMLKLTQQEGKKEMIGEGPAYVLTLQTTGLFSVLFVNPDSDKEL